jgi:hypothetical protein
MKLFPSIFGLKYHERPKPNFIIICPPVPKFKKADRHTHVTCPACALMHGDKEFVITDGIVCA